MALGLTNSYEESKNSADVDLDFSNDNADDNVNLCASLETPSASLHFARPYSVVQSTALPSLGTAWHSANPLKTSFAINRGTVFFSYSFHGFYTIPLFNQSTQSRNKP